MKKKLFVLIAGTVLLFFANPAGAQSGSGNATGKTAYTPAVDSLLNLINTTPE